MKDMTGHIRQEYIDEIWRYAGKEVIKVIVGMRRSGKSVLMRQVVKKLIREGEEEKGIVYVDKELMEFSFIRNAEDLHEYVKGKKDARHVLVDEVQEIEGWEKAIASLQKEGLDVYITGSNANMLSSDLATHLSGRYVKIMIYPLSFQEYIVFNDRKGEDKETVFLDYVREGGFPMLSQFGGDERASQVLIRDIFETIVMKDVVLRHKIRRLRVFRDIVNYVADNIGNTFSAHGVAKYLKSQRIKIESETVHDYLEYLAATFAICRVKRYDLKGKRHLEVQDKYYMGDLGLRHAILGYKEEGIGQYLENIVYLELLRRGYEVSVGKVGVQEIDFVAEREGKREYIQVCYILSDEKVREREFGVFKELEDGYPRLVLSMDKMGGGYEGIGRENIVEWLLKET